MTQFILIRASDTEDANNIRRFLMKTVFNAPVGAHTLFSDSKWSYEPGGSYDMLAHLYGQMSTEAKRLKHNGEQPEKFFRRDLTPL